jgi:hypothetical protein
MMASVAGIAVRDGLFAAGDRVGDTVKDGGYDAAQNAPITWRMRQGGAGTGATRPSS